MFIKSDDDVCSKSVLAKYCVVNSCRKSFVCVLKAFSKKGMKGRELSSYSRVTSCTDSIFFFVYNIKFCCIE